MIKKSKLSVSVHDVEFAKQFQYQISITYEDQQKSTDISALASNPIFTNNNIIFQLPSNHTLAGQVIFVANIVTEGVTKQNKKILGQCSLDLTPFGLQPTQTYNLPIRQQLKFTRSKDGNEVTVGKFISSFKIVQQEDIPVYLQELQTKKIQRNEYFVDLPDFDSDIQFLWRIRLEIREAINVPDNDGIKPQVFVETGWTQFRDMLPETSRTYSSSILNTNNPEWNQTFLILNPSHITAQKGFIMIAVKDNHNLDDIFRIYVPIQSMVSFVPYNIKAIRDENQAVKTELFFSILLQMPYNQKDKLHDILVSDVHFDPIIAPFKTFNLVMVSDSENEPRLNFYPFNVKSDSIERIFEFDQTEEFSYIMSQNMRIPPIKSSKYMAATVLTVSQNLLRRKLSIYIVGKMQKGKYKVAGIVQNIQKDLINLLIEKVKKKLYLSVRVSPNIKMGKCQIQLSDKTEIQRSLSESKVSQVSSRKGEQTATEKLMKDLNVNTSQGLFKHVSQNNEIIVRMLRQLDDKSESLRQAAAEISSLRGKVKLLQNENSILKRNALKQEDELINLVQREVENMSNRDLKDKIAKISHLYKGEKLRSQELDRALKHLEPQVSNSMQLQSVIVGQKNQIQAFEEKILKYKKEFQRISVYKDTIKKQQKVIMKLESVMKEGMQEVRQARRYKIQLQEMKKRGGNMSSMYGSTGGGGNRADRQEIQRLQRIIAEMQMQQSAKMKGSSYSSKNGEQGQSVYELEFKLHQAENRIRSLEEELEEKSRTYGRQLAMFKMKLAQKEAVLNGYQPY